MRWDIANLGLLTVMFYAWLGFMAASARHASHELRLPARVLSITLAVEAVVSTLQFLSRTGLLGHRDIALGPAQVLANLLLSLCLASSIVTARKAFERMGLAASTDFLTGLSNRRGLLDFLDRAGTSNSRRRYAVLQMDLDGFKAINDTLGHEYGDKVLREVAGILLEEIRGSDLVARTGGDEFLAVLLGADRMGANEAVRRVKGRVGRMFESEQLNVSIGIAVSPEDGNRFEALLEVADRRMYEDKNGLLRAG